LVHVQFIRLFLFLQFWEKDWNECSGETCFETVAFFPQIAAVHLACQWLWVYCFSLCSSLEPDVPCERTKEAVVGNPCKLAGGHCDVWLTLQNAP
jgi:hypothetical protein